MKALYKTSINQRNTTRSVIKPSSPQTMNSSLSSPSLKLYILFCIALKKRLERPSAIGLETLDEPDCQSNAHISQYLPSSHRSIPELGEVFG